MSDFTNQTANIQTGHKRHSRMTTEYRVYFALLFIAAIPFCAAIWAFGLIRHMTLPTVGVFQMALSEARTITPRIFWS